MDKETKIFIGFGVAMIALVVVGAIFLSRAPSNAPTDQPQILSDTSVLIRDDSAKVGNPDAKVKIVEFSDFQCPGCGAVHPEVKKIIDEYKDKIFFVYRHFPLTFHKNAKTASIASEAAAEQGKFWEMQDKIFTNQKDWSEKENAAEIFAGYARDLDLDEKKYQESLKKTEIAKKIDNDYTDGIKAGVDSTPTFFINGKRYAVVFSYNELKAVIEEELAK